MKLFKHYYICRAMCDGCKESKVIIYWGFENEKDVGLYKRFCDDCGVLELI